jgi:hypothetical protein
MRRESEKCSTYAMRGSVRTGARMLRRAATRKAKRWWRWWWWWWRRRRRRGAEEEEEEEEEGEVESDLFCDRKTAPVPKWEVLAGNRAV